MKYLVTSALPYANGRLHIGHVAGAYLPADIFVRFLKMNNDDVIYICGTDEHGTPISIMADKENVTPHEIVNRYHKLIKDAFDGINIQFDNFSGTSRPEHFALSQEFFLNLLEAGYINTKETQQFYCTHDERFLPDRYIEGICPKCGASGARGDQCDVCGQIYDTVTLKEPKCKICGNVPIIRSTSHWFLNLNDFTEKIREWITQKDYWKENVRSFMLNLLKHGLVERSITRDLKWGVPVPLDEAEGKVLYVWFDAPIGYISSTVEWSKNNGQPERWKDYWLDPNTKLVHFIGKDNIIFHALIWPSVLMGQKLPYVLPHDIPANEFLTLEGQKLSTSNNWAIWVDEYLRDFDGEYLRYYLAAIAPESKDADFSWKDFQNKINNDLNNTIGNLINRVLTFAKKHFESTINPMILSQKSMYIIDEVDNMCKEISEGYYQYQVRKNVKLILDIARIGNKYFDERKPWHAVSGDKPSARETILVCANILNKLSIMMSPILPQRMQIMRQIMGLPEISAWNDWEDLIEWPLIIGDIKPLFTKIEDKTIQEQLNKLKKTVATPEKEYKPVKPLISYDKFAELDIRIAEIISAEKVANTDKLLHLHVNIGIEERELVAGIAQNYDIADLVGKKVVMLINLEPRKIKGILSQGMILAAESEKYLSVLLPDKPVEAGSPVS